MASGGEKNNWTKEVNKEIIKIILFVWRRQKSIAPPLSVRTELEEQLQSKITQRRKDRLDLQFEVWNLLTYWLAADYTTLNVSKNHFPIKSVCQNVV